MLGRRKREREKERMGGGRAEEEEEEKEENTQNSLLIYRVCERGILFEKEKEKRNAPSLAFGSCFRT